MFQYFFVLNFSRSINTHTGDYGRPTAAIWRLHIMFYTRSTHKRTLHILQWTSAVCLQGAGCRSWSRGHALYRMHRGAGRTRGRPTSFKGRRSRTRGRSQCVLVKIWRSTWNTYLSSVWMSLLDKQEVQDICGHTALHARKWSGFICKRASEGTTLSR